MTQLLGYARCSTKAQETGGQTDALVAAGVDPEHIFIDHGVNGAKASRPGLDALLSYAREGDLIVCSSLDRWSRSLSALVQSVEALQARGISLKFLREGIDLSTPTGRFQLQVFGAMAEFEAAIIKERAAVAREAARARGKQVGRPAKLNPSQKETARRMFEGGIDVTAISRTLGCSRATVYRAVGMAE